MQGCVACFFGWDGGGSQRGGAFEDGVVEESRFHFFLSWGANGATPVWRAALRGGEGDN